MQQHKKTLLSASLMKVYAILRITPVNLKDASSKR